VLIDYTASAMLVRLESLGLISMVIPSLHGFGYARKVGVFGLDMI